MALHYRQASTHQRSLTLFVRYRNTRTCPESHELEALNTDTELPVIDIGVVLLLNDAAVQDMPKMPALTSGHCRLSTAMEPLVTQLPLVLCVC